jgi:hypothetical protein
VHQIPETAYRDTLYEKLFNDEDARACRDIDAAACREVPRNFRWLLTGHAASHLGDALSSPKTVLTWLLTGMGAPAALVAWLVPIREAGSMLPQLLVGGWVRQLPIRKTVWALGAAAQALALLGIAAAAYGLDGTTGGLAVLFGLVIFSIARAFCSVAAKDVLGKTMAKQRRGRISGLSAAIAGGLALLAGTVLWVMPTGDGQQMEITLLLIAAAAWALAAVSFHHIQESPGETAGGVNGLAAAWASLGLLRDDAPFRTFVTVRALFFVSSLSAPYYVVLAQAGEGRGVLAGLGSFVVAAGLADLLASPFWGRFADVSSRSTMRWAAALASGLGVVVIAVALWLPALAATGGWYPLAFFVLGIAHAGVRLGRKTYLVDLDRGNRRTEYVSVSNTLMGVLLLATGLLGLLQPWIGTLGVIGILVALGYIGVWWAGRLPEVQAA